MADLRLEVDRFDWASAERLEVVGRWHGIRGRVFLRPTLDVRAADGARRLLAVLDHKPWIAQEGEEWIVAFPWSGPRALEHADLAVGSETVVSLPHPGKGGTARPPVAPAPPVPEARDEGAEPEPPVDPELEQARVDLERVRAERDTYAGARDAALEQWRRTQEELAALRGEQTAADERRRGLERARDEAVAATDQVRSELRAAEADRDFAQQQHEGAERQRQEAVNAREETARELHLASSSRAEVESERDELAARLAHAEATLEEVTKERDALREQRDAAPTPAAPVPAQVAQGPSPGPTLLPAPTRGTQRGRHQSLRMLAAGALVVIVVVLVALVLLSL